MDSQSQFDIIEVRDGWGPGIWGKSAKNSAPHSESHSPSEYWGARQTVFSTPSFAALYTHGSGTGLQVVSGRGDPVRRTQWGPQFQGWGPPPRGSKWDQLPCQSPENELKFRFSPVPLEAWRILPSAGGGVEGRDSRAPASPFPARQHPAQRPAQPRGAPSGRILRSRRSHPAADPREWRTPRLSPQARQRLGCLRPGPSVPSPLPALCHQQLFYCRRPPVPPPSLSPPGASRTIPGPGAGPLPRGCWAGGERGAGGEARGRGCRVPCALGKWHCRRQMDVPGRLSPVTRTARPRKPAPSARKLRVRRLGPSPLRRWNSAPGTCYCDADPFPTCRPSLGAGCGRLPLVNCSAVLGARDFRN